MICIQSPDEHFICGHKRATFIIFVEILDYGDENSKIPLKKLLFTIRVKKLNNIKISLLCVVGRWKEGACECLTQTTQTNKQKPTQKNNMKQSKAAEEDFGIPEISCCLSSLYL